MDAELDAAGWTELASLAERPHARVLIVQGFDEFEVASRKIKGNVVLTWTGDPEDLPIAPLQGRQVVIWPNWRSLLGVPRANELGQHLLPVAGSVQIVQIRGPDDARNVQDFAQLPALAAGQYVSERLAPITPVGTIRLGAAPAAPQARQPALRPDLRVVEGDGAVRLRRPAREPAIELPPEYSEDQLALNFAAEHGDEYRYVAAWGKWLRWDGRRWAAEETLAALDLARTVARKAACRAIKDPSLNGPKEQTAIAYRLSKAATTGSIERLAKADRRHAVTAEVFDVDRWVLNTPSGLIDLRDGSIRPARPDDHLTKLTNVGPGGQCPLWLAGIDRWTAGNADDTAFLQIMAGYCLTGEVRDHAMFFLYGTGQNGKTTFIETLQWVLGDYAITAPMDLFTERRNPEHSTELAMLRGARMVAAEETGQGSRWNEQRISTMTGGNRIRARFMHKDHFEYDPQFKIVMSGNHRPSLRSVNKAMARRMNMIPFTVQIPDAERDTELVAKLRNEAPGILAWAIEGCKRWQELGLRRSEHVLAATAEYMADQDLLGRWIAESCVTREPERGPSGELYKSYGRWCFDNGIRTEEILNVKDWGAAMQTRGFAYVDSSGSRKWKGLNLRTLAAPPPTGYGEGPDDIRA